MTIRLKRFRYGPGFFQGAGSVLELSDDDERALIAAGDAERLETTSRRPAEHAAKTTGRGPAKKSPPRRRNTKRTPQQGK